MKVDIEGEDEANALDNFNKIFHTINPGQILSIKQRDIDKSVQTRLKLMAVVIYIFYLILFVGIGAEKFGIAGAMAGAILSLPVSWFAATLFDWMRAVLDRLDKIP